MDEENKYENVRLKKKNTRINNNKNHNLKNIEKKGAFYFNYNHSMQDTFISTTKLM